MLSQSTAKQADSERFGAVDHRATKDESTFKDLRGQFDLILNTVSANLPFDSYLSLLKPNGAMVNVGAPSDPSSFQAFSLIGGSKVLAGSNIGGIPQTQEMLDFAPSTASPRRSRRSAPTRSTRPTTASSTPTCATASSSTPPPSAPDPGGASHREPVCRGVPARRPAPTSRCSPGGWPRLPSPGGGTTSGRPRRSSAISGPRRRARAQRGLAGPVDALPVGLVQRSRVEDYEENLRDFRRSSRSRTARSRSTTCWVTRRIGRGLGTAMIAAMVERPGPTVPMRQRSWCPWWRPMSRRGGRWRRLASAGSPRATSSPTTRSTTRCTTCCGSTGRVSLVVSPAVAAAAGAATVAVAARLRRTLGPSRDSVLRSATATAHRRDRCRGPTARRRGHRRRGDRWTCRSRRGPRAPRRRGRRGSAAALGSRPLALARDVELARRGASEEE